MAAKEEDDFVLNLRHKKRYVTYTFFLISCHWARHHNTDMNWFSFFLKNLYLRLRLSFLSQDLNQVGSFFSPALRGTKRLLSPHPPPCSPTFFMRCSVSLIASFPSVLWFELTILGLFLPFVALSNSLSWEWQVCWFLKRLESLLLWFMIHTMHCVITDLFANGIRVSSISVTNLKRNEAQSVRALCWFYFCHLIV